MKIYLIDNDSVSRQETTRMIEGEELGEVVGGSADWEDADGRLSGLRPDLVLADFPLSDLKAVAHMRSVKERLPDIAVIVLTQNHDVGMVHRAYGGGAEFCLHKPVHMTEIRNILQSLELARNMKWILRQAQRGMAGTQMQQEEERCSGGPVHEDSITASIRHLKRVLQDIGILNEAGSRDIIRIVSYLLEEELELGDITVQELCKRMNQNPKSVEQRIRRAASEGMCHLAARGLEDFADPVFNEYAGRFYSFEQMKREMNYIRGKSEKHGNVRVRNFLGGLFHYCKPDLH